MKRQRVQNAIQEYQTQILESIEKNLLELRDKLLNEYENDSASQMSKIKGIPDVSGKTIWYHQFNRKANVYKKRIEVILGENWESLNNGKKLKEIIDFIISNSNSKSKDLDKFNNSIIQLDSSNYNLDKIYLIENKQNKYEIRVNFDPKLIDLFQEVRLIQKFKNVSTIVISRSMENKTNYPFAIALGDAFRTFNNCCEKIKSEPKITKLIAKQKKDIQELIKNNVQTTWSNFPKLDKFTKDICEKVSSFEETVRDLISKISQIESLFVQIQKSPLQKNLISEKIHNIQNIIDEIVTCSNMKIWIKEVDTKLEGILIKKLEQVIST
jgi:dynein heavy chain 1